MLDSSSLIHLGATSDLQSTWRIGQNVVMAPWHWDCLYALSHTAVKHYKHKEDAMWRFHAILCNMCNQESGEFILVLSLTPILIPILILSPILILILSLTLILILSLILILILGLLIPLHGAASAGSVCSTK